MRLSTAPEESVFKCTVRSTAVKVLECSCRSATGASTKDVNTQISLETGIKIRAEGRKTHFLLQRLISHKFSVVVGLLLLLLPPPLVSLFALFLCCCNRRCLRCCCYYW